MTIKIQRCIFNNTIAQLSVLTGLLCLIPFFHYAQESTDSQSAEHNKMVMYYFVDLKLNPNSPEFSAEQLAQIQMDHMKNIGRMVQDKKLLLAGPFQDGGGLFILNVQTMEEAKNLVAEDPAVKAGRFIPNIRVWITEKGLLTLEN